MTKKTMESIKTETFSEGNPKTTQEIADDFILSASPLEIAEQLVMYSEAVDMHNAKKERMRARLETLTGNHEILVSEVSRFLKYGVKCGLTTDQIESFASDNNFDLTRSVTVTFRVDVEYEILLDADEPDVDECDFKVNIEYTKEGEVVEEQAEINGFHAEED